MPLYDYACGNGHTTEIYAPMNGSRPKSVACGEKGCRRRAKRIFSPNQVIPDIPEHFNISIGEVVKNRAHLKQIQKERGLQDYEPPAGRNRGYELVQERLRKGA